MANNHFKINQGISFNPQSAPPDNPANGDIYYDEVLGFQKYENGAWSAIGGESAHVASAIEVTPTGNLASDDVQSALEELQGDIDNIITAGVAIPTGAVLAYIGTSAPPGWLMCDGSTVSRTTYANLFGVIGTSHGQGDGSTTFHLPDYRGLFLRGVDGSAGLDPDKESRTAMNTGGNTGNNVGSIQADEYKSHTHDIFMGNSPTITRIYPWVANFSDSFNGVAGSGTGARGGNETRPKNAYVNFIIKY